MKTGFGQGDDTSLGVRDWVNVLGSLVSQDCRVNAIVKGSRIGEGWFSTNPVVVDRLISIQDSRIPLAREDGDRVHRQGFGGNAVGLDDGEIMSVDGESIIRVTGNRY